MYAKGTIMDRFIELEIWRIKDAYEFMEERRAKEEKILCENAKKIAEKLKMEFNHFWNTYIV
jgi:hypothetical protein